MVGSGWASWLLGGWAALVVVASCGHTEPSSLPSSSSGGEASAGAPSRAGAGPEVALSPNGLPWLGQSCVKDADCGMVGLRCLAANQDYMDGRGSPPGGVCTADCAVDTDCRAFDSSAVCATWGEVPFTGDYSTKRVPRLCMQGCSLGAPAGATKCHGRDDFACRPFAPESARPCGSSTECATGSFCFRGVCRETACGPRCNSDADCRGRYCNPSSGLCDSEPVDSAPLGTTCPGDADPGNRCGGRLCLAIQDASTVVEKVCAETCRLGTVCGKGEGACVSPRLPDYALGDAGYCLQRCNCDDDCLSGSDRCFAWPDALTAEHYGSKGVCKYLDAAPTSLRCATNQAGAGGAGNAMNEGAAGAGGASN